MLKKIKVSYSVLTIISLFIILSLCMFNLRTYERDPTLSLKAIEFSYADMLKLPEKKDVKIQSNHINAERSLIDRFLKRNNQWLAGVNSLQDKKNQNELLAALGYGDLNRVKTHIDKNVDSNTQDKKDHKALMAAISKGNIEKVN